MDLSDLVDFVLFLLRPGWRRPGRSLVRAAALAVAAVAVLLGGRALDDGGGLVTVGASVLAAIVTLVAAVTALGAVAGAVRFLLRRLAGRRSPTCERPRSSDRGLLACRGRDVGDQDGSAGTIS